jgi:predicted O-methyltransferase YrrM
MPAGVLDAYRRSRRGKPRVRPHFEDVAPAIPIRPLDALFPGIDRADIIVPASQIHRGDSMLCPAPELLAIGAICAALQPSRVFEIGTYTGSTTLIMSRNTPPHARITTLDLAPGARDSHRHGLGTGGFRPFPVGAAFQGTPGADRIEQVFADSTSFSYDPYLGQMDLVFIDADHTYAFVQRDTEAALRMLKPGGVIIWDDYVHSPAHPECAGVTRCVNELAETRPCYLIEGTRLAIMVDPHR